MSVSDNKILSTNEFLEMYSFFIKNLHGIAIINTHQYKFKYLWVFDNKIE